MKVRWLGLVVLAGLMASCGGEDADPYVEDREACVAQINTYRATIGLEPLERWTEGESCTDGQARSDAASGVSHEAFGQCGESAQNECPGWSSVEDVNAGCLEMMWNEGPPAEEPCEDACYKAHGHYINMTQTRYTKVACGYHVTSNGSVWAIQNFQ